MCISGVAFGCAGRPSPIGRLPAPPCASAGSAVDWHGPTAAADRARLNAWCASVGDAVVVAPTAQSVPPTGGVVIVTWNVHEGAGDLERLVASLRPADVIVLVQEAMRRGDRVPAAPPQSVAVPRREPGRAAAEDIVAVAERLSLWLAYVPSMRNGRDIPEDRGNAILSTLPLSEPRAIELPWVHQRRVAVMATVAARLAGRPQPLRLVSVHLDNRPGREAQATALARWLRAFADDASAPLVVGGDLNTWFGAGEDTVQRIAAVVPLVAECGAQPTFRFRRRLDFLFSNLSRSVRAGCDVADDPFGSDHRAVRLRLR